MKKLLKKLIGANRHKIDVVAQDTLFGTPWQPDVTEQEKSILRIAKPFTMTSQARLIYLVRAVEYLVRHQIPGAIIECGVWRGGSMMAVAEALRQFGDTSRQLYLFDTFSGMSEPTEHDRKAREAIDVRLKWEQSLDQNGSSWCYASLEDVKTNLSRVDYPQQNMHFIKGPVEQTLPQFTTPEIGILRLDTDWYESTKVELQRLYPGVVRYGVIILDDYGSWEGAKQATDEFLAQLDAPVLLNRIDATARAFIK
jgi:O-methyltransferase